MPASPSRSPPQKPSSRQPSGAWHSASSAHGTAPENTGHAVDNARAAVAGLEVALAAGVLERTPVLDQMLADLARALDQDEGQRLGGKSAEAARFILRAVSRELDNA